ncbi:MAG: AtpZ/AtpI family protein [Beijerinckiaceae bacterium]
MNDGTRDGTGQNAGKDAQDAAQAPSPEELRRAGEDAALKARLGKLSAALDARRQDGERREQAAASVGVPGGETGKALSLGFRALSEFVAGIIAGGGIGWLLDKALGTAPALLLIFGLLGTVAGFWNVYRVAMNPSGQRRGKDEK